MEHTKMENINSAAEPAYDMDNYNPALPSSNTVSIALEGGDPPINTVSEADVGMTPSPNEGVFPGLTTTTSYDVPDEEEGRIRSASEGSPVMGS